MKHNRMLSALCAAVMGLTVAASLPAQTVSAEPVELFFDDFEDGDTDGWASHGGAATVSLTTEVAHTGESSMYITDREQNWQGAECSKVGYYYAGQSYTCSLWFYYDDEAANATQNFQLGYKYVQNGETRYGSIGSVTATKGEWAQMTANVTFAADITGITLYTQCDDTDLPYYIDDCSGTGEVYQGETQDGFSYDFEDGNVGDWFARSCDIAISTDYAHSGSYSLYTSGRTELWNSPAVDCTLFLEQGGYYSFSCWATYAGENWTDSASFQIYLMYNEGGVTQYKNLAAESTVQGEWVQIATRYTIPEGVSNLAFYIQPTWSSNPSQQDNTIDFYIDDVVCTHLPDPQIEADLDSLCAAYEDLFKVGCASTVPELSQQATKDLILKHYNSLTFGNELKPDSVLNQKACQALGSETEVAISLAGAEPLLQFAADNDLPVRGHTLVWHSQTPDWFFREGYSDTGAWVDRDTMLARMENYIREVLQTLAEEWPDVEFYCWDVVNETFRDDGNYRTPGSTTEDSNYSPWIQTIGEDFVTYAFTYARKYAPEGCKLFYNDFNEYAPAKRDAIVAMVEDLAAEGLIDGVGMQSHLKLSYPTLDGYEDAIRAYSALGLEVQITELDVDVKDNSNAAQLELAERYRSLMECIINCKKDGCNITAVVFWGITDSTSWIGGYPLLFDEDYCAKPAFYAVLDPTAPVQTIQNKNAIDASGTSLEDAFAVQSASAIGTAGSFKAAWDGEMLTLRVNAKESGRLILCIHRISNDGTVKIVQEEHIVNAGTTDFEILLADPTVGAELSIEIVLNDVPWNSLTLENALTPETAGTITLAAYPICADAAAGTVTVDGEIDAAWENAPMVQINRFQMGNANENAYGTAKMLWDSKYVYVLVEVTDPNGTHSSSANHYETDTVEIFFDENNNKSSAYQNDDMQCRIGFDGSKTVSDNHSVDDYLSAAATTANGYLVEVAIPYSISPFTSGQAVGFDVQINDDNGSGARAGISNWSGDTTGLGYTTTQYFGVLMLEGETDPSLKLGDVNEDGQVKIDDVILLNRLLAEDTAAKVSEQGILNADVTRDGIPAPDDSVKILEYLAGIVSGF